MRGKRGQVGTNGENVPDDKARQLGTNGDTLLRVSPLSPPRVRQIDPFWGGMRNHGEYAEMLMYGGECKKCYSNNTKIGITKIMSGATVYPLYCGEYGEIYQRYVKKEVARKYEQEHGELLYVKTRTERYFEKRGKQRPTCEACGAPEGELHHWAPQYLFRDAPQGLRWPTSYLCRSCHRLWHAIVTPDMGRKKP